ncbi:hypothetical protein BDW74DRAFT_175967 [Aspergillus multicolor]|uniref:uncharacterized protein n=1 Tax=Aspergillus multicolor TaxID=41759 RepID=UPI003CCCE281
MFLQRLLLLILSLGVIRVKSVNRGQPGVNTTFDYVVVGAGTSGFTVAARLAEANYTVALVEAGDFYALVWPFPIIPGAASLGIGASPTSTTPIDWQFTTQPVPGANNRSVHYCRRRTMGGSSAANIQIYQRLCYVLPWTSPFANWKLTDFDLF